MSDTSVYPAAFQNVAKQRIPVGHWLGGSCPPQARMEIFGTTKPSPLCTLSTFPDKLVALARRTLYVRRRRRQQQQQQQSTATVPQVDDCAKSPFRELSYNTAVM